MRNGQSQLKPAAPAAVRITRRYRAPARRVFDAWLDPQVAGRWLFATALRPMTHVAIDARVGGSFRFVDRRDGSGSEHRGRYLEIVPHRRLVFSLVGSNDRSGATRVTVEIVRRQRGCEVIVSHHDVAAEAADHTRARWTGILYGLGETLS